MKSKFIYTVLILSIVASYFGYSSYKNSLYESDVYFSYTGQCGSTIYVIDLDMSEITGFFKMNYIVKDESIFKYHKVDGIIKESEGVYIFDFNDGKAPSRVKRGFDDRFVSVEKDNYFFNTCNSAKAKALIKTVLANI